MKKLVRCRACGFIMDEEKLGDKCPACGAPKIAFEPYTDPMGEKRRRLLKLDLHPVAVHFPVSFSVLVLLFSIVNLFLSGTASDLLVDTIKIMALLLPVFVIIAGILGYNDGKVRFRKIKISKILKAKILYAGIFFVVAAVLAAAIWTEGFDTGISTALIIVLAAGTITLSVILGLLGVSINKAAFPGN